MEIILNRGKIDNVFFSESELSSYLDCQHNADIYTHLCLAKKEKKRAIKEAFHWFGALVLFTLILPLLFIGCNS